MTGLEQVSALLDSPEGATTPWPTYTVPPVAHVVPAPRRPLRLTETTIARGPRPSLRTTSYSKPLRTGTVFAGLTTQHLRPFVRLRPPPLPLLYPVLPPSTMVHGPVVVPTLELPLTPGSAGDGAASQMPGFHL